MAKNGRIRSNGIDFSIIPNSVIDDTRISLKAKGLYCMIQRQLQKENWSVYKSNLSRSCSDGQTSFETAWKELIDTGYLKAYRLKDEKSQFYWEYELLQYPESDQAAEDTTEEQKSSKPIHGFSMYGKGGVYTEDITTEDKTINNLSPVSKKTKKQEKEERDELYNEIADYVPEDVKINTRHKRRICEVIKGIPSDKRKPFMQKAYKAYESSNSRIKNPLAYFLTILLDIIEHPEDEAKTKSPNTGSKSAKPSFDNFGQRNYDYDKLLKAFEAKSQ